MTTSAVTDSSTGIDSDRQLSQVTRKNSLLSLLIVFNSAFSSLLLSIVSISNKFDAKLAAYVIIPLNHVMVNASVMYSIKSSWKFPKRKVEGSLILTQSTGMP